MDADVEIRVVADEAGHVQPDLALPDQLRLDLVAIIFVRQQLGQPQAKLALRTRAARQPGVEHGLRQILEPVLVEQVGDAGEVEHIIADGDARPASALGFGKNAQRQVLDREIAARRSALDPAHARGVVRFVDHGSCALEKPAHASS